MRYVMIAALLCACASITSGRPRTGKAGDGYDEFHREFVAGNYDKAKTVADEKKVDRRKVAALVLSAMRREVFGRDVLYDVMEAKSIADKFELDRAIQVEFAQKSFDESIASGSCDVAADLAFWFDLGEAYADGAINCAMAKYGFDLSFFSYTIHVVCNRPGTKALQSKVVDSWIQEFKRLDPAHRGYTLMASVGALCPLTSKQYSDLFAIGLQDKNLEFAKIMLGEGNFEKTAADYENFIALAVAQYKCGMAADVALEQKFPKSALEAIFLNPKCFGGTLWEMDLKLVSSEKVGWLFDLSLRAREFKLARRIIKTFSLDEDYFKRVADECFAAQDYEEVLRFEPWGKESGADYRDRILNRVLDANEEWFVTRFVVEHSDPFGDSNFFSEAQRNVWVERAFLRALRRNAYDLAADIARQHKGAGFGDWGARLAFEAALLAKNTDQARYIARRWHLNKEDMRRVMLVDWEINKEKARKQERELRQRKKRDCKSPDNWSVKRCR